MGPLNNTQIIAAKKITTFFNQGPTGLERHRQKSLRHSFVNGPVPKKTDSILIIQKKTLKLLNCKLTLKTYSLNLVARELKMQIADHSIADNKRFSSLERLCLLNTEEAVSSILDNYNMLPQNENLRPLFREKLLDMISNDQTLKESICIRLKLMAKAVSSGNDLSKNLLNEIDPTQPEPPSLDKSYVKKVAEKHPMTTPTALIPYGLGAITSGALLIGSSYTLQNDNKPENDIEGLYRFRTGVALVGVGVGTLGEAGRQVYNSIYTK
jgi:hypothetical protein